MEALRLQPQRRSMRHAHDLPPVPPEARQLIERVRDTRFAHGRSCPHCRSTHVVLWGSFRCRMRYRCRGCSRTFSDLTATPYSYSKKPELWPAYQDGMRRCLKLRPAAADVGIHLSTSFRWRHAILRRMPRADTPQLHGWTELTQFALAYSAKGNYGSRRGRSARSRGSGSLGAEWQMSPHVHLLVAQSRTGTAWCSIMSLAGLRYTDIAPAIRQHASATLLLRATASPAWRDALKGVPHIAIRHDATDHRMHLRNALDLRYRIEAWLEQFRGVATKYLSNYLAWHRLVDVEIAGVWSRRITLQCSGGTPFS